MCGLVLVVFAAAATTGMLAVYTDQDGVADNTVGTGDVNQGATPTVSATGQTVTVSWAATTTTDGRPVSGYLVRRYDAVTPFAEQAILSACTGTITALACTENSVPAGSWTYSVTPVFGLNWHGGESARSDAVVVESTPPVNAITLSGVSGGAYKSGDTVYYRGTTAGSFTLTNALTDAGSGPASSATAALGGTTTGWTHTDSTVSTPAGGPYVSNAFAWADGTSSSPSEVVTGRDVANNTATTTLNFINDSTAPSAGTIDYVNTYTAGRSVTVTFTTGTDGGSGIATRQLQRASATLSGGSCGSYGSFANVGGTNPTSPWTDIYVGSGTCYQYRYVVTDNVGNQHTATSAKVAKVDYASAVNATAGALGQWRLGEATTSSDSMTGTAGTALTSHTGEIGATWTHLAGTSNAVLTDAGRVRKNGTGHSFDYTTATPPSADYAVEADLYYKGALSADYVGVIARLDPTTKNFYSADYWQGDQKWSISKFGNGAWLGYMAHSSAAQALSVGSTYRIRLEVSGSSTTSLKLYVNGVLTLTGTNSTSPYTAAGKAGILDGDPAASTAAKTDSNGLHVDNFTVVPQLIDSKGTNHGGYFYEPSLGAAGATYGDANTAAQFDGTNDFGRIARQVSTDFSVEFWFKSTQGIGTSSNWYGGAALVDNTHATDTTNDWGTSLRSDGKVVFGVGNPNTSIVSSTGGYNDGAWHHVVATRQASNGALALYVDGTLRASAGSGPTANRTAVADIAFGAQAQSRSKVLAGTIDEVSLYTAVLNQTTVTNHYELGTEPPVEPPTGPSGGSVDAGGLVGTGLRYSTSTTLSVNLDKGTDTDGVAATGAQLLRATATLTSTGGADGTCGTFGSYTLVTGGNDPVSPKVDTVADQACYRYQYVVADTLGNPTTYTSGDIKVDTTAPSAPTFAFSGFSNAYWGGSGSTVYYRPAASTGGFTVTATSTDSASGIASYAFPALGTNWSSTPGALGVNAYSWSGAPAAPGSPTVTATNHATITSATGAFTLTEDSTAPTSGTVTYVDGDTTGSISVSFTTGTDGGSGVGTRLLQRASATLTGGTCGSFGSFATVTDGTNPTSPHVDPVSAGNCYMYQYVVSDNVGNTTTATSTNVAKVTASYLDTVLATSGLVNYYRLGEATTSADSFTGSAGTLLSDHTGETGATWTRWVNDTSTAVLTDANRLRRNGPGGVTYLASAVPSSPDYQVSADVHVKTLISDDYVGVVGRQDPTATSGGGTKYTARYNVNSLQWELYRHVNGTGSLRGTSAHSLAAGQTYNLALNMSGSTIRLLVDGVQRVSVTDSTITTAGRGGVRLEDTWTPPSNTTGLHLDNFQITPQTRDSYGTNHGDYFGGPTLGVTGGIAGDADTAAQFDGVNDYASLARQISDDFTIEFWFKSTQGIGTDPRWTQGAGLVDCNISGTNNDFGTSLRADGRVVAGVGGGSGDTSIVSSSGGYNDGQWHHVVMVRTRSTGAFALYVDGASAGSATNNTNSLTAQSTINIGRLASSGNHFAGTIDEVAFYNVALSGATISAHYAAR